MIREKNPLFFMRYTEGRCYFLAAALHKLYGAPLVILRGRRWVHFIVKVDRGRYLDARGFCDMRKLRRDHADREIHTAKESTMDSLVRWATEVYDIRTFPEEMDRAWADACIYLREELRQLPECSLVTSSPWPKLDFENLKVPENVNRFVNARPNRNLNHLRSSILLPDEKWATSS